MTRIAQADVGGSPSRPAMVHVRSLQDLIHRGAAGRVELALFRRSVASRLVQELDRLSFEHFKDFRADGPAASVEAAYQRHVIHSGWAPDVCAALLADVSLVLAASEARTRGAEYTVRLEHITGDACSKFHKDNTDFRLVTTYLGQGTQWARLAKGALGQVQTLNRFDVAMFLGQRTRSGDVILHRSPPVGAISEQRLLLVVDVERPVWRAKQG